MVKRINSKPINSLIDLEEKGYISELEEYKSLLGASIWNFRMGKLSFHYNDNKLNVDFSKYKMNIVYRANKRPPRNIEVRITNITLPKNTKHIYPNGSLCLFKPENFKWKKSMTIKDHLFTSICTWLFFYETWKKTGIWYGEEAEH